MTAVRARGGPVPYSTTPTYGAACTDSSDTSLFFSLSLSDDVHINKVLQRYGLAPLIAGFSNKGGEPGADAGEKGPQISRVHTRDWRKKKFLVHVYSSLMASAMAIRLTVRLEMTRTYHVRAVKPAGRANGSLFKMRLENTALPLAKKVAVISGERLMINP